MRKIWDKPEAVIRVQALLIFMGSLIIFTLGLSTHEIIGFESRFYLFALEMWCHGPSWFPTTYQQPYPDYPATSTLLIYLFSKCVGYLDKFTAVFPSALASAVTLMMTYLIGALHSKRWGLIAVLFLLFTITFFVEARTISLDQYIAAITTICFYLIYSGELLHRPKRFLWIFPLFVLGFIFRGPIGLVIPTGVVCVFYLIEKNAKRFWLTGLIGLMLLLCCSAALLAIAYHVGGVKFLNEVLQMEVLGRIQDAKSLPFYFYFQESFGAYAVTYPVAILVLLSFFNHLKSTTKTHLLLQLFGWALIVLVGLSFPADKKVRYVLAISPALALISGYLFYGAREQVYLTILRSMFVWFCFYFPGLCIIALLVIHYRFPLAPIPFVNALIFLIAAQFTMLWIWRRQITVFVLAVLVFVSSIIWVVEPLNLFLNKTHQWVQQIESLRSLRQAQLVFYREGMDGWVIKYLINMPEEERPIFIKNSEDLAKMQTPLFIISRKEKADFSRDNTASVAQGYIGRDEVVVFSKNVPVRPGGF